MPITPSDPAASLRSTITIISGNLHAAAQAAPLHIDNWIDMLRTSGKEGFADIETELQNLKGYLDKKDRGLISSSLHTLGQYATKAAAQADDELKEQLHQLGQTLTDAAQELKNDAFA